MVGARLSISPPRSNGQPPTLRPSHPISRARKISSQQASRTLISKYFYSNPCIACTCKPKPPPTLAKASQYRCRYIQSLADTLLFFFCPNNNPAHRPHHFCLTPTTHLHRPIHFAIYFTHKKTASRGIPTQNLRSRGGGWPFVAKQRGRETNCPPVAPMESHGCLPLRAP